MAILFLFMLIIAFLAILQWNTKDTKTRISLVVFFGIFILITAIKQYQEEKLDKKRHELYKIERMKLEEKTGPLKRF